MTGGDGAERVAGFLRARAPALIERWAARAGELARARSLDRPELLDHLPGILAGLADALDPRHPEQSPPEGLLVEHAVMRLSEGLDLPDALRELALLRDVVLAAWIEEHPGASPAAARLLDAALDRVVEETVRVHLAERDRKLAALHGAIGASEAAARRSEEQLRFLAEAGQLLAGSLDVGRTAQQLADLAVPRIADWCLLDLVEPGGAILTAAVATADPDPLRLERIRAYRARHPPSLQHAYGTSSVIVTGRPLLVREVTEEALRRVAPDEDYVRWVSEAGLRSILSVPVRGHAGVLGAFALGTARSRRALGEDELRLAEALAARAALAIDNARLYEQARRAVRLREDVLAVVSHDLRTPLHAIRLTAQVLARRTPDERALRNVQSIERAAGRAISLLRDLLDMASIQAGKLAVQPVRADAAALADEAAELHAVAAQDRGIVLAREGQGGAVNADPARVLQVLGNLVGNALKFSPRGSRVVLRLREAAGGVRFEVEDAGPGVRPEELARLCDAWWTEGRGTGGERGTGLGLFIAREILARHGAELGVESATGGGSTFHFTLPRP